MRDKVSHKFILYGNTFYKETYYKTKHGYCIESEPADEFEQWADEVRNGWKRRAKRLFRVGWLLVAAALMLTIFVDNDHSRFWLGWLMMQPFLWSIE
jgi:hypothetical protein